jgi:hypothetical protein
LCKDAFGIVYNTNNLYLSSTMEEVGGVHLTDMCIHDSSRRDEVVQQPQAKKGQNPPEKNKVIWSGVILDVTKDSVTLSGRTDMNWRSMHDPFAGSNAAGEAMKLNINLQTVLSLPNPKSVTSKDDADKVIQTKIKPYLDKIKNEKETLSINKSRIIIAMWMKVIMSRFPGINKADYTNVNLEGDSFVKALKDLKVSATTTWDMFNTLVMRSSSVVSLTGGGGNARRN